MAKKSDWTTVNIILLGFAGLLIYQQWSGDWFGRALNKPEADRIRAMKNAQWSVTLKDGSVVKMDSARLANALERLEVKSHKQLVAKKKS